MPAREYRQIKMTALPVSIRGKGMALVSSRLLKRSNFSLFKVEAINVLEIPRRSSLSRRLCQIVGPADGFSWLGSLVYLCRQTANNIHTDALDCTRTSRACDGVSNIQRVFKTFRNIRPDAPHNFIPIAIRHGLSIGAHSDGTSDRGRPALFCARRADETDLPVCMERPIWQHPFVQVGIPRKVKHRRDTPLVENRNPNLAGAKEKRNKKLKTNRKKNK